MGSDIFSAQICQKIYPRHGATFFLAFSPQPCPVNSSRVVFCGRIFMWADYLLEPGSLFTNDHSLMCLSAASVFCSRPFLLLSYLFWSPSLSKSSSAPQLLWFNVQVFCVLSAEEILIDCAFDAQSFTVYNKTPLVLIKSSPPCCANLKMIMVIKTTTIIPWYHMMIHQVFVFVTIVFCSRAPRFKLVSIPFQDCFLFVFLTFLITSHTIPIRQSYIWC